MYRVYFLLVKTGSTTNNAPSEEPVLFRILRGIVIQSNLIFQEMQAKCLRCINFWENSIITFNSTP